MISIPRSYRRLVVMLMSVPVLVLSLALIYRMGMAHLEHQSRTLGESLEWAAETLTTVGYGRDTHWEHPLMQGFVIFVEFGGVMLIFLVIPVFVIPFLEERFEARLPTHLPDLTGQVLIYRHGPEVTSLIDELAQARIPVVLFEEDEATARRLHDRGYHVVLGNIEEEDPDLRNLVGARGMVANGHDDQNAALTLSARYHGFEGPIVALVDNPNRRPPMLRAGATSAFTPDHILAAALASRASVRISPRVAGVRQLGHHVEVGEMRVTAASPLAGKTIGEAGIRAQTGATIVGLWMGGVLVRQPSIGTRLEAGSILVAVGSGASIGRLGRLTTPVPRTGPFLVVGNGDVGHKVAELLRDAGETVRVLDERPGDGVDIAGDALSPGTLEQVGARETQAVILTLETDSATLFAAGVVRNLAPDALIIAGASRAENVSRIHRSGADFALSVSQVAGQVLSFHLLGQESVSLEAEIKLVATSAGPLEGRPLVTSWIRERTGCSVVAIERGDDVIVEFGKGFTVEPGDIIYLSGTKATIGEYFRAFPGARTTQARRKSVMVDGILE